MSEKQKLEWVEIDPDLLEIVPEYLETKKKEAKDLMGLLDESCFSDIQVFGHSLKGSGGGYGFDKLSEIGAEIETYSKEKNVEKLNELAKELQSYLERVRITK